MCASAGDRLSLDGAVHGGAGDVELLSELARGMRARAVHVYEVTLLGRRQFRLLAPEMAFRFSHLHSLSGSGADEVGFELCHYRKNVKQQTPDRVGRTVNGSADAEFDTFDGELVDDVFRIPQAAGVSPWSE